MDDFEQKLNQILNDPNTMAQITALANGLSGGNERADAPMQQPQPSLFEGDLLKNLAPLLAQMQSSSAREEAVFSAIRPYVSDRSQKKIDRAIRAAKVSRMAGLAWNTLGKQEQHREGSAWQDSI